MVSIRRATANRIARAVGSVLADKQYAESAVRQAEANRNAGGAAAAADIIERAVGA